MEWNTWLNALAFLVLALMVAGKLSPVIKFYIKQTFIVVSLVMTGALSIPYGLLNFRDPHKIQKFTAWVLKPASWILGVDWHIHFKSPHDQTKSHMFVCNHQSALDVIGMLQLWPLIMPCFTTAKKELKYAGPFGLILYLCGTIFVDRMSSEKGRKAVNEAGQMARETGSSIWVFPEGTRNHKRDGSMLPFKKGAFHVAVVSRLPVVPVIMSEYDFYDTNRKFFRSGHAHITVLDPIPIEDYPAEDPTSVARLLEKSREIMLEAIGNNNKKHH
ncbi:hypothetical protein TCAL_09928 [Tigriopus californicus]|uniref:1-acyl-sn-glycerol-3-phosphate acyltransferase n=1 Tax=Tigriopus californicus TaxID=6832 RepID=A0A553NN95_TIGCA|nr:1-acyl-sn-glycerol-3-phosphate acyltransferase alpha-like [Tigriopus californicus]TRY66921.1 hypothetical protein TCAL_09928 [Tigriopus californicus]|eukprot:TCALIF_09928-PA protein Name:"Similar to AGPAT1 1-acyl-sn-glycerol-3-phosphate acyltransferase alpha (Bos taurus)" AED:0.43 eAED:0.43 QI:398/1/1/1/1/1/2/389/272